MTLDEFKSELVKMRDHHDLRRDRLQAVYDVDPMRRDDWSDIEYHAGVTDGIRMVLYLLKEVELDDQRATHALENS